MTTRPSKRAADQMRQIVFEPGVSEQAEGSCLVHFGKTRVLCTASVDESVPPFIRGTGQGWVTAEYGMLPRSTHTRMSREAARGKQSGRTQEIQRLIGRSLRAVTNRRALGERQITIDCDVINADGGTRTAAITGGYIALHLACKGLQENHLIAKWPLTDTLAAVSCGLYRGAAVLDLDYDEDSAAEADANFVLTGSGNIVEVQGTAEDEPFSKEQLLELLTLAHAGIMQLTEKQKEILEAA